MKIMFSGAASLLLLCLLCTSASAACKYYAYVDYGPAMTNGELNNKQNVYRSSGLKKYEKGFRAAYTNYESPTVGSFTMINIGPYDTELVAYDALNKVIADLQTQGYKAKTNSHNMPAILLFDAKSCE